MIDTFDLNSFHGYNLTKLSTILLSIYKSVASNVAHTKCIVYLLTKLVIIGYWNIVIAFEHAKEL